MGAGVLAVESTELVIGEEESRSRVSTGTGDERVAAVAGNAPPVRVEAVSVVRAGGVHLDEVVFVAAGLVGVHGGGWFRKM